MKVCSKKKYKTRQNSLKHALIFQGQFGSSSHPYPCRNCGKFHLTSGSGFIPPKKVHRLRILKTKRELFNPHLIN